MSIVLSGSQYVYRADWTDANAANSHTFMAWLRWASFPAWQNIYYRADPGDSVQLTGDKIETYQSGTEFIGSTTLAANTWYHVAVSKAGSTKMVVYLNGLPEVTVASGISSNAGDSSLSIFAWARGADFMSGRAANLLLYNAPLT